VADWRPSGAEAGQRRGKGEGRREERKEKEKMEKKKENRKIKKRERGREKRDRARASEICGGDRGLVGHARIFGRHAARRAEREKGDGTSGVRDSGKFPESRV
jgi:hypothetical protein